MFPFIVLTFFKGKAKLKHNFPPSFFAIQSNYSNNPESAARANPKGMTARRKVAK